MRYIRPETRQFLEVGYRLFRGKFLRFMSGPRNTGQVIEGKQEKGFCISYDSEINFAVPSLKTLTSNKLSPIYPGVFVESICNIAKCIQSPFVKIGVDGKKISHGKGKVMGDIDCWGFEDKPTLNEKKQRYKLEQAKILSLTNKIEHFVEKDYDFIPENALLATVGILRSFVQMISHRIKDLRLVIVRLQLGIEKFTNLGDQYSKHWSKSRYAPVISSLKVSKYDAEQAIESALQIIN